MGHPLTRNRAPLWVIHSQEIEHHYIAKIQSVIVDLHRYEGSVVSRILVEKSARWGEESI